MVQMNTKTLPILSTTWGWYIVVFDSNLKWNACLRVFTIDLILLLLTLFLSLLNFLHWIFLFHNNTENGHFLNHEIIHSFSLEKYQGYYIVPLAISDIQICPTVILLCIVSEILEPFNRNFCRLRCCWLVNDYSRTAIVSIPKYIVHVA